MNEASNFRAKKLKLYDSIWIGSNLQIRIVGPDRKRERAHLLDELK